jgi:hypothetical protein
LNQIYVEFVLHRACVYLKKKTKKKKYWWGMFEIVVAVAVQSAFRLEIY